MDLDVKLIFAVICLLLIVLWEVISTQQRVKEINDLLAKSGSKNQLDQPDSNLDCHLTDALQQSYAAGFDAGLHSKIDLNSTNQTQDQNSDVER